jgi:hypothetical protein
MDYSIWLRTTSIFEGQIIAADRAQKWITNFYNAGKQNAAGEKSNDESISRHVSSYFPVEETKPDDILLNDESGFYHRIVEGIQVSLSSRPLPESQYPGIR